ncbi:MAG: type II secretion system protein [Victivallales bacterium]|nr:type II secretion system protein [Victivallales bacterium]
MCVKSHKCHSFTLIELLVVIAIISILAGMIMPAINQALEKAKDTACVNNLKQFSVAIHSYQIDYRDQYPPWISTLFPDYSGSKGIYHCRKDRNPATSEPEDWVIPWGKEGAEYKYSEAFDRPGSRSLLNIQTGVNALMPNSDVTKISYFYEFTAAPCTFKYEGASLDSIPETWGEVKVNEMKSGQLTYSGVKYQLSYFPIIRCIWHVKENKYEPVLNLSVAGNVFKSNREWETGYWDF